MIHKAEIEAAAAVLERVLWLIPPAQQQAVLALVAKRQTERPQMISFKELKLDDIPSRNAGGREDLMAKAAYLLTRDITKCHSAHDAAQILFQEHFGVPGSGRLLDYIGDLPRNPSVRRDYNPYSSPPGRGRD